MSCGAGLFFYRRFNDLKDCVIYFSACNVVYLNCVDTESLTGPQAISRALHKTFTNSNLDTTIASFKVASDGITVTDTQRK